MQWRDGLRWHPASIHHVCSELLLRRQKIWYTLLPLFSTHILQSNSSADKQNYLQIECGRWQVVLGGDRRLRMGGGGRALVCGKLHKASHINQRIQRFGGWKW